MATRGLSDPKRLISELLRNTTNSAGSGGAVPVHATTFWLSLTPARSVSIRVDMGASCPTHTRRPPKER